MSNKVSRRTFLGTTATAAAAFSVIPSHALGSAVGQRAPSDKLNIAVMGLSRGNASLRHARNTENIVALCDVDWAFAKPVFDVNPTARKFWDYRVMFDQMARDIDAVIIATPDHGHAIQASAALTLNKHLLLEKPLTHSVYESRLLTKLAERHTVATSMSNWGSSGEDTRTVIDWIANGEIGDVRRVDTFTNRPIWPQGLATPRQGMWVPDTLNWDLFTGPAKLRPYHSIYHPWNHRGWWDYGTGALGDMACHIMHAPFKGLRLGYPTKVQGTSTQLLLDCAPHAQHVKYTFPARPNFVRGSRERQAPEVVINWYDGGIRPEMPAGWPAGRNMDSSGGAAIFYGTRDVLVCGCYGRRPWLLSGRVPANVPKTQREVPVAEGITDELGRAIRGEDPTHTMDWIRACKENAATRVPTASPFSEAGPFNEMVVMGVLAVRLQGLYKELEWDGANMQFTNIGENEEVRFIAQDNFTIEDGHPSFGTETVRINAREAAAEMIKHTYREGWALPAMPA